MEGEPQGQVRGGLAARLVDIPFSTCLSDFCGTIVRCLQLVRCASTRTGGSAALPDALRPPLRCLFCFAPHLSRHLLLRTSAQHVPFPRTRNSSPAHTLVDALPPRLTSPRSRLLLRPPHLSWRCSNRPDTQDCRLHTHDGCERFERTRFLRLQGEGERVGLDGMGNWERDE